MTDDPNWTFIALAYGVTILSVGAVAASIVLEHRRLREALKRIDPAGARDAGDAT